MVINGTAADERLRGGAGADSLDGDGGNDTLEGGGGRDSLNGGDGTDLAVLRHGHSTATLFFDGSDPGTATAEFLLRLGQANVPLVVGTGIERFDVTTGRGNDRLIDGVGSSADDTLRGGGGDDTVISYGGADSLQGGAGLDRLVLDRSGAVDDLVFVLAPQASLAADGTRARGFEALDLFAGAGDDSLGGGTGNDNLLGGAGDDTLAGGGGSDWLGGGAGDDLALVYCAGVTGAIEQITTVFGFQISDGQFYVYLADIEHMRITGGSGNDRLQDAPASDGADTLRGGAGDDTIASFGGVDLLKGGAGQDHLVLSRASATADLVFRLGPAARVIGEGTRAIGFESVEVTAGSGNDTLAGGAGNDGLAGGDGSDLLIGRGGSDLIQGGRGHDIARLDYGDATLAIEQRLLGRIARISDGEFVTYLTGIERIDLTTGAGDDTIEAGRGRDRLDAGAGTDLLVVNRAWASVDLGFALAALAEMTGTVLRAAGFERVALAGGSGNDSFAGGALDDTLEGGAGDDTLAGGGGHDLLFGGAGADLAVIDESDATADLVFLGRIPDSTAFRLALAPGGLDPLASGGDVERFHLIAGSGDDSLSASAGADTLEGGAGEDLLLVDRGEATHDLTFLLSADATLQGDGLRALGIERVALTGGSGHDSFAGGTLDDTLEGGAGDDTLDDGGGGSDFLIGGEGEDLARLDHGTAAAALSFAVDGPHFALVQPLVAVLASGEGIERFHVATGDGDDVLTAGDGADTLEGGVGADTLTGGGGFDVIGVGPPGGGVDLLSDFDPADDTLQVSAAGLGGLLPVGPLDAAAFATDAASLAGPGFLYLVEGDVGLLSWSPTGGGGADLVLLARLVGAPALAAADIILVS